MIQIFITGGTLDKDYNPLTGELFFPNTHLPKMLSQTNLSIEVSTQVLFQKDSLDITDKDKEVVLQACKESPSNQIIITHGTDTMPETARYLKQYFNQYLTFKTIIFTGAMRPFILGNSDALFNLGSALMAAQSSRPGVFIAMNGKLFDAKNVVKNKGLGVFEINPLKG